MNAREILTKAAIFTAFPVLVVVGLGALYWPTIYFTTPVLVPFAPYFEAPSLALDIAYVVTLGGVSGVLARSKSWPRSIAIFLIVCVCGALMTHVAMNLLGYDFIMETP